jgi:DNA adenine methylase Dam
MVMSELGKLKKGRFQYYKLRETEPSTLTPSARAARFIYLNRFCFNGLYRTNRLGQFNVPYGGNKSGNIPSAEVLGNCSMLLKNARLITGDFENVLRQARSGDFVYMDPPFSVKARRVFNEYVEARGVEAVTLFMAQVSLTLLEPYHARRNYPCRRAFTNQGIAAGNYVLGRRSFLASDCGKNAANGDHTAFCHLRFKISVGA